jgi:hypothetical protein
MDFYLIHTQEINGTKSEFYYDWRNFYCYTTGTWSILKDILSSFVQIRDNTTYEKLVSKRMELLERNRTEQYGNEVRSLIKAIDIPRDMRGIIAPYLLSQYPLIPRASPPEDIDDIYHMQSGVSFNLTSMVFDMQYEGELECYTCDVNGIERKIIRSKPFSMVIWTVDDVLQPKLPRLILELMRNRLRGLPCDRVIY